MPAPFTICACPSVASIAACACSRSSTRSIRGSRYGAVLSELMDACGSVRDRDIAAGLLQQAGLPAASPLLRQLDLERRDAVRELQLELRRWRAARLLAPVARAVGDLTMAQPLVIKIKWDESAGPAANAGNELPRLVSAYFSDCPRVSGGRPHTPGVAPVAPGLQTAALYPRAVSSLLSRRPRRSYPRPQETAGLAGRGE